MIDKGWSKLSDRRHSNDIKLYIKIMSGMAAVGESIITVTRPAGHDTRTNSVSGYTATNTQKHPYKHKMFRFLNLNE